MVSNHRVCVAEAWIDLYGGIIVEIELNFLPFESTDFSLTIYRKRYGGEKRAEGFFVAKLPDDNRQSEKDTEYFQYLIALSPFDGATEYQYCAKENPVLMCSIIWYLFKEKVKSEYEGEYEIIDKYNKFVSFVVQKFQEGTRNIKVSPYYLASKNQYGFILDFSFRKYDSVPYGRRIQELSFSIDKAGKSNANSYLDKLNFTRHFIDKIFSSLSELKIGDFVYYISNEFSSLRSEELKDREYIFSAGRVDTDKLRGIKNHPYASPNKQPLYVFVFKEDEKDVGNELFKALSGKTYPSTFPGMKKMFDCELSTSTVTSIIVDLDKESEDNLIRQLQDIVDNNRDKQIIGIFIDSYSDNISYSLNYTRIKHTFFSLGIPLQAVRKHRILASDGLKWAASGIGLQILSKLGGIPWLVKPSTADCLIFGIGMAHEINERRNEGCKIKKYFAYSVCFDSTGVYKSLGILGESENQQQYLKNLEINIIAQVKERLQSGNSITSCVIHTPFKMRNDELKAIKNGLEKLKNEFSSIDFTVIKINTVNRFFGFADNNLKIPYESSFVKLSKKEYLIWFDGLKHGKEYINKRIANPTHIEFIYTSNDSNRMSLLQDIVNLAGASWRGFNAKLVPISIYYPQLIARFIRDFRKIDAKHNFTNELAQFSVPWFL